MFLSIHLFQAKLGAAVTVVLSGIDVIITQCRSNSAERFVYGDWKSIADIDCGTLISS